MTGINTALDQLLTNPKDFLANNALIIYGSNKGKSGENKFVMQATNDTQWKSGAGGGMRSVPFYVMYKDGTYNGKGTGQPSTPFDAYYISMREYNEATGAWEDTNDTHFTLPARGDIDIVVTSKLNGCTFGIGSTADGTRLVSHLRPPTQLGPAPSRLTLDAGTRSGFEGGRLDASVMSSTDQNGTVIGRRTGTKWKFYAQRFQISASFIDSVQTYG